jgi:hypothetical protein
MPELQRVRGKDWRYRSRIATAREDVDDDVGRVDAFGDRLGAGGFHCRQSVGEASRVSASSSDFSIMAE